jgi:hypothetical protein
LTASKSNWRVTNNLPVAIIRLSRTSYGPWSVVVCAVWDALVESLRGGYAYYVCHGKSQAIISRRDEKCPARYIPVEQLDELVWQDVCEVLKHPDMIAAALQRAEARAVASTSAAGEA